MQIDHEQQGLVFGNSISGRFSIKGVNTDGGMPLTICLFKIGEGHNKPIALVKKDVTFKKDMASTINFLFENLYPANYLVSIYRPDEKSYLDEKKNITLKNGIVLYKADGTKVGENPMKQLSVGSDILAVDLSNVDNIPIIVPSENRNTLYYFAKQQTVPEALKDRNVIHDEQAKSIQMTDEYGVFIPKSFTAEEITYTRETAIVEENQGWQTLILPFRAKSIKVDGTEIIADQAIKQKNVPLCLLAFDGVGNNTLYFKRCTRADANVPYLLYMLTENKKHTLTFHAEQAKIEQGSNMMSSTDTYIYQGTFAQKPTRSAYILSEDGKVFKRTATSEQKPFRAFFEARSTLQTPADRLEIITDVDVSVLRPTGIAAVRHTSQSPLTIYTLNGLKVSVSAHSVDKALKLLSPGIYIINNRKYHIR